MDRTVTPSKRGSRTSSPTIRLMPTASIAVPGLGPGGNRVTALRWALRLRELGWHVFVEEGWSGRPADLLVALHARKSGEAIERWRRTYPGRPVVVAATGTDVYEDLEGPGEDAARARAGFDLADRIVVLQQEAVRALPEARRACARVVHQSLPKLAVRPDPDPSCFEVVVLANLRSVKDPLLPARAVARLPDDSRVVVRHYGEGLEADLVAEARRLEGPRWSWRGVKPRRAALCALASARLCVSPSRAEGGANVVTEALALDVPVLATRIPGATGLLGDDHPGLFPVGDVDALAVRLRRAEDEPEFLARLRDAGRRRAGLADPARERAAWRALLAELDPDWRTTP